MKKSSARSDAEKTHLVQHRNVAQKRTHKRVSLLLSCRFLRWLKYIWLVVHPSSVQPKSVSSLRKRDSLSSISLPRWSVVSPHRLVSIVRQFLVLGHASSVVEHFAARTGFAIRRHAIRNPPPSYERVMLARQHLTNLLASMLMVDLLRWWRAHSMICLSYHPISFLRRRRRSHRFRLQKFHQPRAKEPVQSLALAMDLALCYWQARILVSRFWKPIRRDHETKDRRTRWTTKEIGLNHSRRSHLPLVLDASEHQRRSAEGCTSLDWEESPRTKYSVSFRISIEGLFSFSMWRRASFWRETDHRIYTVLRSRLTRKSTRLVEI